MASSNPLIKLDVHSSQSTLGQCYKPSCGYANTNQYIGMKINMYVN